jgi:hypothetical protein
MFGFQRGRFWGVPLYSFFKLMHRSQTKQNTYNIYTKISIKRVYPSNQTLHCKLIFLIGVNCIRIGNIL